MKQRLKMKIVIVALLGLGMTGLLLAGLSAHAGEARDVRAKAQITRWDGVGKDHPKGGKGH